MCGRHGLGTAAGGCASLLVEVTAADAPLRRAASYLSVENTAGAL